LTKTEQKISNYETMEKHDKTKPDFDYEKHGKLDKDKHERR